MKRSGNSPGPLHALKLDTSPAGPGHLGAENESLMVSCAQFTTGCTSTRHFGPISAPGLRYAPPTVRNVHFVTAAYTSVASAPGDHEQSGTGATVKARFPVVQYHSVQSDVL